MGLGFMEFSGCWRDGLIAAQGIGEMPHVILLARGWGNFSGCVV